MAVKSITGTFMGQDIYYIGYPMPDGWTYFNDAMLRRCRTSATSPITYVETGMDYYQSQRWSPTEGFSLTMTDFSPDDVVGGGGSVAPDASVEAAVLWAIQIANDDTHGYDQANRNGPDYDCSSLVSHAFQTAGFDVPICSTSTMRAQFIAAGFVWLAGQGNTAQGLQRGDILLKEGSHTEIYIGNQQNVGAHINEFGGIVGGQTGDQTGSEISVTPYRAWPWDGVLRWYGDITEG